MGEKNAANSAENPGKMSQRLIDADAFWAGIKIIHMNHKLSDSEEMEFTESDICALLAIAPTIDAVPVVHGRWIRDHGDYGKLICSRCECRAEYRAKETELGFNIFNVSPSNFCPNCGATMDLEAHVDSGSV